MLLVGQMSGRGQIIIIFKDLSSLGLKAFSVLFTFMAGKQTKKYINNNKLVSFAFEMGNYLDGPTF